MLDAEKDPTADDNITRLLLAMAQLEEECTFPAHVRQVALGYAVFDGTCPPFAHCLWYLVSVYGLLSSSSSL